MERLIHDNDIYILKFLCIFLHSSSRLIDDIATSAFIFLQNGV